MSKYIKVQEVEIEAIYGEPLLQDMLLRPLGWEPRTAVFHKETPEGSVWVNTDYIIAVYSQTFAGLGQRVALDLVGTGYMYVAESLEDIMMQIEQA